MRAITNDMSRYRAANLMFKDKYFSLPGDMTNAYSFWQGKDTCTANSVASPSNNNGCNGNGDGTIDVTTGESFKVWMHLKQAGLVEGGYTGYYPANWGGQTYFHCFYIGTNIPGARGSSTSFFHLYSMPLVARGWFTGDVNGYRNRIMYSDYARTPLTSAEAWNIDTKLDDGRPGLGAVTANQSGANCSVGGSTTTATAEYNLSANTGCTGLDFAVE
ncbi:MAG: hypothetical protein DI582_03665 [Azospirillum brasilense]|nr:MAG: hypothetical protein DI582_03665 [Azospirillum brasilense]